MVTLINGDLYQWDTGRVVLVEPDGDSITHEVHFTTKKMDFAYVVNTYIENDSTYCAIPNILLQQYQDIYCYEVQENSDGEETVSTTVFDVIKRNRPVDYVYTEPEKLSFRDLQNQIDEIKENLENIQTSVDEAVRVSNEAYDTAETTKLSVDDLGERVVQLESASGSLSDEDKESIIQAVTDNINQPFTQEVDSEGNVVIMLDDLVGSSSV